MKKEEKLSKKIFVVIGTIFIIGVFAILIIANVNLQGEKNLYKTLLYSNARIIEAGELEKKANEYYDLASFYYEKQNYELVESNCMKARDYYSDTSQEYLTIRSELLSSNINDKLINIEVERLDIISEIQLNMFEACEHFESAVRYYDFYYNTDVPYDDMSYEMGGGEIESMNEKIRLHDENIRIHNKLLSDFEVELKKRIE